MVDRAPLAPLQPLLIELAVRAALLEDLGRAGDITTDAVIPAEARLSGVIAARQAGVVAGVDTALLAFRLLDPAIDAAVERPDGTSVATGDAVIRLEGPARPILSAERVALNLLCRLSGIASVTARLVQPLARTAQPGSCARARRRPACEHWRNTRCGRAVDRTTASAWTTPC